MNNWQYYHTAWSMDFVFYGQQIDFFKYMTIKHPGHEEFLSVLKGLRRLWLSEQKAYKRQYGEVFRMRNTEKDILIKWIRDSGCKLNAWELSFLKDIEQQKWTLSEKQKLCLMRVYEKCSGGGIYERREFIG